MKTPEKPKKPDMVTVKAMPGKVDVDPKTKSKLSAALNKSTRGKAFFKHYGA